MTDTKLRKHLVQLLRGSDAHISLQDALQDFPIDKAGIRPTGSPHSAWELLEHLRIAQEDIALFSGVRGGGERPEGYVELKFPDDLWPASPGPADEQAWLQSVAAVERDLDEFIRFLEDPKHDLFTPFRWGDGQTLLREALLIADHNAYHAGQLMLVRRMLSE